MGAGVGRSRGWVEEGAGAVLLSQLAIPLASASCRYGAYELGAAGATPSDLIKVRMQAARLADAAAAGHGAAAGRPHHTSLWQAMSYVYRCGDAAWRHLS